MNRQIAIVLDALWRQRVFIIGITVAALLVGVLFDVFVWKPRYSAEVKLVINALRMGEEQASDFIPEVYHAKAYEDLLLSTNIVGKVRETLIDEGLWQEAEAPPLEEFALRLKLATTILDQTTRPVNYSPFITLQASARTPEHARTIVNTWARIGVETAKSAAHSRISAASDRLTEERDQYETDLKAAMEKLAQDKAEYNIEVLKSEIDALVLLIGQVKDRLLLAEQDLVANQQRYEAAKQQLSEEKPIVDLFQAPSDEVFWLRQSEEGTTNEETLQNLQGKGFLHQTLNQVYIHLRENETEAKLELAAAQASVSALKDQLAELEVEKASIREALAVHSSIQQQLDTEIETLRNVFTDVARIYAYVDVAAGLSETEEGTDIGAFGISRLTDDTYVREEAGLVGAKIRILLMSLVAFGAAVIYVALYALAPSYIHATADDEAPAPGP